MKKILFSLLIMIFFVSTNAQSTIDYHPKQLIKSLKKDGINDTSMVKEIKLSDSLLKQQLFKGKFFIIDTISEHKYKYIYVGRVNSCRAGGCNSPSSDKNNEDYEYFDYFIIFDIDKVVKIVKVFNYQATHGQEVSAKGWLNQFSGYDGSKTLQVDKDIDAISGATISVYAITYDVEIKTKMLKDLFSEKKLEQK